MSSEKLKVFAPAFVLALFGFVIAFQFVDPAPPTTLTISAGQPGGAYYAHAESYRDYLQQIKQADQTEHQQTKDQT